VHEAGVEQQDGHVTCAAQVRGRAAARSDRDAQHTAVERDDLGVGEKGNVWPAGRVHGGDRHDESFVPFQLATSQPVHQRIGQRGPERDAHARQSAARRTPASNLRPCELSSAAWL
jgi:hypothetical protein